MSGAGGSLPYEGGGQEGRTAALEARPARDRHAWSAALENPLCKSCMTRRARRGRQRELQKPSGVPPHGRTGLGVRGYRTNTGENGLTLSHAQLRAIGPLSITPPSARRIAGRFRL